MQTAAELAILFIESDDKIHAAMLARRIRHYSQSQLIHANTHPRDARGTEQFDVVAACTARILSECAEFGIGGDLLRSVADCLAPRASGVIRSGGVDAPHWGEAIPENTIPPAAHILSLPGHIRLGENWELNLNLKSQGQRRFISGGMRPVGEPVEVSPEAKAFELHQHIRRVGSLKMDVTALCRPIVQAYDRN